MESFRLNHFFAKPNYRAAISFIFFLLIAVPTANGAHNVTDVSITDAVEDQLLLDDAVILFQIDVSTIDGIVTLEGTVDNLLAKERAARIAKIVKGVRSVINKIKVEPPDDRTARQIRLDVERALVSDPATDAYEVDVAVTGRVVILTGVVQSWREKNLCETVAKGIKGVVAVVNDIRVEWLEERSDFEIKAEIEKALEWDAFVDDDLISVEVKDGTVTLTGVVGSAAEKDWAYLHSFVNGVDTVNSAALLVKRWARDDDLKGEKYSLKPAADIEQAVEDALLFDPRVSAPRVTAEMAENGTIILRGTVDNLKARLSASQDARNTVGVRNVENRIRVRPAEVMNDQEIAEEIRGALSRDPFTESYEIMVTVNNGVAKLRGTVDSFFEKAQADDVVSKIKGVIMVDNKLQVLDEFKRRHYDPYIDAHAAYDYEWDPDRPRFPSKGDRKLKEDIRDEFFWSPFVDGDDIDIEVDDGTVTLKGRVDSWSEYNAAANNAYEAGAVYVDNELTVDKP